MKNGYISGHHDWSLVALSCAVAGFAAYVAIDIAQRVFESREGQWKWLGLGALALGGGIWSMHFIGMEAFAMPIPMGYSLGKAGLSLAAAIAVALLALWVASRDGLGPGAVAVGAVLMGLGICVVHYTGMAAMEMTPAIQYRPGLFAASVLIAVAASGIALWILFDLRRISRERRGPARLLAAAVMALAIAGMHYTGMAAARFPIGSVGGAAGRLGGVWTIVPVAVLSLILAGLINGFSRAGARRQMRRLEDRLRHEEEERARFVALFDPQTKLPNRASFQQEIVNYLDRAKRTGMNFDFYYVSLNYPASTNAEAVDQAVVTAATRLRGHCRPDDLLARYARQEFVLLRLRQDDHEAPEQVRASLRLACSAPVESGEEIVVAKAHIGFARYPADGNCPRTLLFAATRSADSSPPAPSRGKFAIVR